MPLQNLLALNFTTLPLLWLYIAKLMAIFLQPLTGVTLSLQRLLAAGGSTSRPSLRVLATPDATFTRVGTQHSTLISTVCRLALALTFRQNDNPENFAKVYAVTGQDTAFGPATSKSISWSPKELPADLIIAIEVAGSKKHWMEPGDYSVDTIRSEILSGDGKFLPGKVSNRFHVIFADFQVWALSTETPFEKLKPFLTKTGASTYDRDELLKPYRLATYNDG